MMGEYDHLEITRLTAELAALRAERDGLREIVERLPKTADGVPITGIFNSIWMVTKHKRPTVQWTTLYRRAGDDLDRCYSTREAAEAARKETP